MLQESKVSLTQRHDLFMFDLDGVIYVGPDAVPGVPAHLTRLREAGVQAAFVTNNASRPAQSVANHLRELGIDCEDEDVVNSAQAAATLLRTRHAEGTPILVLGGDGLIRALEEVGLVPVTDVTRADVAELVTGFGPEVVWHDIMRAARRVKDGLAWTASNTDRTFPTAEGALPGHGMLVSLIAEFAGQRPEVAGKPERPLLDATIARKKATAPIMVGDRLDTDIEGGHNAGVETMLVLTGVSGLDDIASASVPQRPTYICPTLADAFAPQPVPVTTGETHSLGGWQAQVLDGELAIQGAGSLADWWRVAATACWAHLDAVGTPAAVHRVVVPVPTLQASDG